MPRRGMAVAHRFRWLRWCSYKTRRSLQGRAASAWQFNSISGHGPTTLRPRIEISAEVGAHLGVRHFSAQGFQIQHLLSEQIDNDDTFTRLFCCRQARRLTHGDSPPITLAPPTMGHRIAENSSKPWCDNFPSAYDFLNAYNPQWNSTEASSTKPPRRPSHRSPFAKS